jgi:hypothetical protein
MIDKPAMKLASRKPMDGSGKQTTSPLPAVGEELDKKRAAWKQRMKARTEAIKRHLTLFIAKTTHPPMVHA